MKRKFIISIIILSVILGAVGLWFYQKNIFSKDILKLEILGPREATMGDEIEYTARYKNNGKTALKEAKLIFEYPENSIPKEGGSQIITQSLDDIYPGEEKSVKFQARLLGKENELKEARAKLSFRPKNLKAFYVSETSFTTAINFVPITLEFDLPSKVESGRDLSFSLNYFSNVNWPLSNLGIKAEYPFSFEFLQANPKSLDKNEWQISLLNKAEGGRIRISGKIFGEQAEQQIFKAQLGIWQDGEFILLKEATKGVELIKPSIYISQKINDSIQYIAGPGDLLHYEIFFKNVGEDAFRDLFLVVRLDGEPFDLETLKTTDGEFKKGDSSVIWDSKKVSKLRFLGPNEENRIEFWINLKKDWPIPGPSDKNPSVKDEVILGQARETFITKINSNLELAQKAYFSQGPFQNSGPLPPKVGESTTYTILWQAKNYYNDVKNVKVKAILPSSVNLTGEISPKESRLTFDQNSREIIWEVGDLTANAGILNSAPEINFQIKFNPNSNQRGQVAKLIDNIKIIGEDSWTGQLIEIEVQAIDTGSLSDEGMGREQGIVQ